LFFKDVSFDFGNGDESRQLKSIGTYSESTNLNSSNHLEVLTDIYWKKYIQFSLKDLAIENVVIMSAWKKGMSTLVLTVANNEEKIATSNSKNRPS